MTAPVLLFDRWASVYDGQPNPLLQLEERTLPDLLPPIPGASVLDVGCGTGRWLKHLERRSPASLTGIDPSSAMLARARAKLDATTLLQPGDASNLPAADATLDLVLASFVLSYLPDLANFARESFRVLRPGCHLVLSDMHPVTAAARGWSRTFKAADESIELAAHTRSIATVIDAFAQCGFLLASRIEAPFSAPERDVFEQSGKLAEYESLTAIPAIYLLKLQKPFAFPNLRNAGAAPTTSQTRIANAPWSTGPNTWCFDPLSIGAGSFTSDVDPAQTLDLSGYVVLPGLVNAHDHLEFALFPNLGRAPDQPSYQNSAEWARDIHQQHAATIHRHLEVPLKTRLWWGAIRNLVSGVTTVCHHNPLHPELSDPSLPVHVVQHFGWAHSLTFDANLADRFAATPHDYPFLLHAGEGMDASSVEELHTLDHMNLLDARTVLVHGLAFGAQEMDLLNRRAAGLILCPTSNLFLFARTLTRPLIQALNRAALGSDSPLTASGDLLDEIQFLHATQQLDPSTLYRLVTTQPAGLLRLRNGQGSILPGAQADLIAVPVTHGTPAGTVAHLTLADVELVLRSGQVQLASPTLYDRLAEAQRIGLHLLEIEGHMRWVRAPLPTLFAAAEAVLGSGNLRLGNKEVRLGAD